MDLDMIVFGEYTLKQLLVYGGFAVGILFFLSVLKKMFATKKPDPHTQVVQCKECGWNGRVSQYAGRCPKCSNPLGAQKAKRQS